jgi:small subunit ribosomal protein MRP21
MAGLLDAFTMKNKKGGEIALRALPQEQVVKPLLKLGPNVGRSFAVDAARGMDVARAFRQLDSACNKNRVRNDFMKQRFHERPGLKRKRIRYEGKIKGFKGRFIKVVQMVQKMTKSGW